MIVTVTYYGENRIRYSTRALSSHATLAELLAWAQENCREGELLGEVSFLLEQQQVEVVQPFSVDHFEVKRLSQRLFH